ncbi:asparagine synthase (glutamine-hydrolysing) [Nitrosomonas cryotolerans]|uniref:asparagine synthase (glutamine-hydrolyzing) n=1 Tax=Nitrosomonas cryotolerans ATCC 49181 TaxID=1131553 RepID=A0A1N6J7N4_9PROT|nr:XrtA/PEP-CTERM system amidotransferase [Nitrosomonas cryotolerans]SFP45042.1 asparagine synthase (glutamine-hydrolysing) [Nitrosomonas cryotolerans]SIO40159.1 asparagine synthase (glutamine-hydrolysing) [Nitrosomonas cryotolerans ATCC 49181]
MCGIVGLFDMRGKNEIDRQQLGRMNQTQLHRGPDEGEIYTEPGVGLGHRRLSIMDVSTGQQPLFNEDASVVVVFNGEIYNFRELKEELLLLGHRFRTHSDTEVIVHAWEEWGEHCVDYFRGMFAFGLWDRNQEILFLARDRLGIKPLYYAVLENGLFIFSSELKALLAHSDFDRTMDPYAIEDYFAYGYIPEPRTVFKQALKLSPAHTLKVKCGQVLLKPHQYWDVPFVLHDSMAVEEVQEELTIRLREAVNLHLMTEVPLGAFLSGGVDSSAVVAMMSGLMKEPVNTCSISFGDPAFNESRYAQMVADRYHTRHHMEQVEQDDFDLIDKLASIYDEPFADSSAIPTYRVCKLARERVTVVLSGDGGDENLAGYRRYRWHLYEEHLRSLLSSGIRKPLFGLLGNIYPKADWAPRAFRAKATFEALARDSVEGYFHSVSITGDKMRQRLFTNSFKHSLQGYQAIMVLRDYANKCPTQDPLSRVQYLDMKTYLVGDILTKVDRASMAHALEVRVPLLDHKLVEWISGLPPALKLNGGEGKYIFKKALEPYLPNDILYRDKMGFSVPLASWFRGALSQRVRKAILGPVLTETGIFNMIFLEEMLDQHQSGRRDYSALLWALLMFESFLRNVLYGDNMLDYGKGFGVA